ncbi:MAG: V-type ATP synthase subunit C [Clostridia bacterium]|nr:V-type ATP synthase subunit C [Clostridia bacterium]
MLPETRYAYAVARVRVAELNMLGKGRIERMIEADTAASALRVLNEAGYAESDDYEFILKKAASDLYAYMKEISPEPGIFDIFAYRYDSHNIKVLLKAEFAGTDGEGLFADNGVIDLNSLALMVRERDVRRLPPEFASALTDSIDAYSRTRDPQIIDIIMDGAYYVLFKRLAEAAGSSYLSELAAMTIDIANINAFIRIKARMVDLDLLSRVLIKGGGIPVKRYTGSFGRDIAGFREEIKGSGYGRLLDMIIENPSGLTEFEKACDNHIMDYLRKFRFRAFGIEPLVGYMLGKETDIKNARIILVGKINRINGDVIRERLRNGYV